MTTLLPVAAGQAAVPIQGGSTSAPSFVGAPASQNPVFTTLPPQNPFMAPNERSEIHVDAYQTDTNALPGPLGRNDSVLSTMLFADCASVTFDSRDRLVAVCVGLQGPTGGTAGLNMFDPKTLDTLAHYDLPPRQPGAGNPFQDFSSGGYFYLDNQDRAIVPTTTRHIFVIAETGAQPGFAQQRDYDVTSVVPSGDKIVSALPDWSGRIWFASANGVVGYVEPASGAVHSFDTHEKIGNSFAVDEQNGVYVVSDGAMYRFGVGAGGAPAVVWRSPYPNDGTTKPGQTEVGSGTTPTVMTTGPWVAITDNADPIDIVVFNKNSGAQVCSAPVFSKGASDTDQSLVAVGNALIAENNYGYSGPAATEQGGTTTGGLDRVDVNANGAGCHKVWHSDEIAPSVVPKASLANGLVYTYTKPKTPDNSDPWYLTALDFRTGRTVFKQLAGEGLGFNNNYAPVTLGPDGTAYVGTLGGLVAIRDATPPPRVPQSGGAAAGRGRPRLTLRLRYGTRARSCGRRTATATLTGADARLVTRVDFRFRGRRVRDRRAPFRATFLVGSGRNGHHIAASAVLRDGRRRSLSRSVRPCALAFAHRRVGARFAG